MIVSELIEALKKFDPSLKVIIAAEGVWQGPPVDIDIEDTSYGKAVVLCSD